LGLLEYRIAAVETAIQRAADPRHLLAGPPNHGGTVNQQAPSNQRGTTDRQGPPTHQSSPNHQATANQPAGEQNRPELQNHRAKITNIPH
ncbi:hypothetical protein, partial [Streptomyces sp. NPDC052107]|uniref:hypothetical protein n=1 Tax=Streptomyces sp. NPDC052107 TaxID=3155632 RepID=UPI00343D08DC